ncbi:MAG: hypothetical protein U0T82_02910 [Bacteroidales bacterium]
MGNFGYWKLDNIQTITGTGLKLTPADTMLRILAVKGGFNLGPISIVADPGLCWDKRICHSRREGLFVSNPARMFLL